MWHIPTYEGDIPPNTIGDVKWSVEYTIISVLVTFTVAILVTFLFEKPINNKLLTKIKNVNDVC